MQELFPLTRVEKRKGDPGAAAVWKERYIYPPSLPLSSLPHLPPPPLFRFSSNLDLDSEAPPTKRSQVGEDTDFSMASLARGEVRQVSILWFPSSQQVMPYTHQCGDHVICTVIRCSCDGHVMH